MCCDCGKGGVGSGGSRDLFRDEVITLTDVVIGIDLVIFGGLIFV